MKALRGTCKLCGKKSNLINSHIIPSFVGKWLKDTSITGYLRQVINANQRKQDITKQKLLCAVCEQKLSINEKKFRENIFIPYVNEELNEWAIAQGKIKYFDYDQWLLEFIIGLQWRSLVTSKSIKNLDYLNEKTKEKYEKKIDSALQEWKDFLLGNRFDSGESRHYILFLQNLAFGKGQLPEGISENVNRYLIRSVDATLAISLNSMFLYTKMGPIVVISALSTDRLRDLNDSLIRLRGKLKTAQNLTNQLVNQFVFIDRPNEVFKLYEISKIQQKKIEVDIVKKAPNAKSFQQILLAKSDDIIKKRIK